jgi:hypothetical protein
VYQAHRTPTSTLTSRLKLVEFIHPGTEEPRVCSALWQCGADVRLLASTPHTLHLGLLQRSSGFAAEARSSLQRNLARVLGAWRTELK